MSKLPTFIKKELGLIIRTNRILNYNKVKIEVSTEKNPYSRENLCKGICHYHTLAKIENDYSTVDEIYYQILNRLGLSFDISIKEHEDNLIYMEEFLKKVFYCIEYIDNENIKKLYDDLKRKDFNNDCIMLIYMKLIEFIYRLGTFQPIQEEFVQDLLLYKNFFKDLFSGLFNLSLSIHYLNTLDLKKAEKVLSNANDIFIKYDISKGLLQPFYLSYYFAKQKYLEVVNIAYDLEQYFIKTNNYNRLLYCYTYLTQYYQLIHSKELAHEYFEKTVQITNKNHDLERYQPYVYYNYGLYLFTDKMYDEAYKYLILSLSVSKKVAEKLRATNLILFTLVAKKLENEMGKYIDQIGDHYLECIEQDQIILKYFKFKYEKNPYYKKFAVNKVIPLLKSSPSRIDYLLLIYEDLYE